MVVMLLEMLEDLVVLVVVAVVLIHALLQVLWLEMVTIHQQLLHKEILVELEQELQLDHKKLVVVVELVLLEQMRHQVVQQTEAPELQQI